MDLRGQSAASGVGLAHRMAVVLPLSRTLWPLACGQRPESGFGNTQSPQPAPVCPWQPAEPPPILEPENRQGRTSAPRLAHVRHHRPLYGPQRSPTLETGGGATSGLSFCSEFQEHPTSELGFMVILEAPRHAGQGGGSGYRRHQYIIEASHTEHDAPSAPLCGWYWVALRPPLTLVLLRVCRGFWAM